GGLCRAVAGIRRLPDALRPYRAGAAGNRFHRQDYAGGISRGDGHRGDVPQVVQAVPAEAPVAGALRLSCEDLGLPEHFQHAWRRWPHCPLSLPKSVIATSEATFGSSPTACFAPLAPQAASPPKAT